MVKPYKRLDAHNSRYQRTLERLRELQAEIKEYAPLSRLLGPMLRLEPNARPSTDGALGSEFWGCLEEGEERAVGDESDKMADHSHDDAVARKHKRPRRRSAAPSAQPPANVWRPLTPYSPATSHD